MKATQPERRQLTGAQKASVYVVYALLGLAQIADLHSTALGLNNGRVELNPFAEIVSHALPPLAAIALLKAIAAMLFIALLRTWASREDAADFHPHVFVVGCICLIATAITTWSNYA